MPARLSTRRQELTTSAKDAAAEGKRGLSSQALHYGNKTDLHWRRHQSLIENDGEWKGIDIPYDVTRPVTRSLDRHWIVNFNAIPDVAVSLRLQIRDKVEAFVKEFSGHFSARPDLREHAASIGAAMAGGVDSMLEAEVEDFQTFLQERRKGYAEDVKESTKKQISRHLAAASLHSGPGSFQRRKADVTRDLPKVDLKASVSKPSERIKLVSDQFSRTSRSMTASTCAQVRNCYAGFWDGQKKRSQKERDAKAALRSVLHVKLDELSTSFSCVKDVLPSSAR